MVAERLLCRRFVGRILRKPVEVSVDSSFGDQKKPGRFCMSIRGVSPHFTGRADKFDPLMAPSKEGSLCAKTQISELFAKVFEGQGALTSEQKMQFGASWWKCWGGWQEPEMTRKFDLELKAPFGMVLRNPTLLEASIKNLPSFTVGQMTAIVSFLGLMSNNSQTLQSGMDYFRSLPFADDKEATVAVEKSIFGLVTIVRRSEKRSERLVECFCAYALMRRHSPLSQTMNLQRTSHG
jgi:hypothetical protein